MATKTRSSRKNTTPTEEVNEVTDTATAPVAADPTPETPATEATAPVAEAPKPEVNHEDNLFKAIMTFSTDKRLDSLQDVYRTVPVAARGKVQGLALKNAMNNGVDLALLGEILEAFSNMPVATKTTRVKSDLDPAVEKSIRLAGAMIGFERLRAELGDEAFLQAAAWYNNGGESQVPDDYKAHVESVANSVATNTKVKSGGQRGPRSTFKESFSELVARGGLPKGATLKGAGDVTATVTEDGKIQTEKGIFDAPSAAVKGLHLTKDGKETSTNGWKFWTYEGKTIGSLRNQ